MDVVEHGAVVERFAAGLGAEVGEEEVVLDALA